jgi:DNA-binding FadR family transcriptional regulator
VLVTSERLPTDGSGSLTRADEAVFRPVREGNAFEETVERLLQAIKLGVVVPGERLPAERELAARFKVARVTLREAIRALADAGYVESRRGRYGGTFVRAEQPPRRSAGAARRTAEQMDFEDALLLRDVLERGAAEAAAASVLSQSERLHLRGCLDECAAAAPRDYRRMDSRLHLAIAEVTGSSSLTAAVADARMRLNALLDAIPLLERNIGHSNAQHVLIVEAVLDGDAEAARRAMAEHLDGTSALLRGFLA